VALLQSQTMFDTFIKLLDIAQADLTLFLPFLEKREIARGNHMATDDSSDHHIVFILKGCLRSCERTTAGSLHSHEFFIKNELIIGPPSVLEAVENSLVLIGGPEFIRKAIEIYPEFVMICMKRLEQRIRSMQKHLYELTHLTTEERYLNFLESFPSLAVKLPQRMIAAYLGMTPESLSRTRKKLRRR
jgi:CRP-like cAMP-binding protein